METLNLPFDINTQPLIEAKVCEYKTQALLNSLTNLNDSFEQKKVSVSSELILLGNIRSQLEDIVSSVTASLDAFEEYITDILCSVEAVIMDSYQEPFPETQTMVSSL